MGTLTSLAPTRTRKCITARTAITVRQIRGDADTVFVFDVVLYFWGNNLRAIAIAAAFPLSLQHVDMKRASCPNLIHSGVLVMHGCLASQCVEKQGQGSILKAMVGRARYRTACTGRLFSIQWKWFSIQRKWFSIQRKWFSIQRKWFSIQRKWVLIQRKWFSIQRKW